MRITHFIIALCVFSSPAFAQSNGTALIPTESEQSLLDRYVFLFGGRMGDDHMYSFFNPFDVTYDNTLVIGGGYQQFMLQPAEHFRLGTEIGIAARIGEEKTTAEIWGGVVGRYDGFVINDTLRITPSVTFGMSLVTDTTGEEAAREVHDGRSAGMVFYLSPEISVSLADNPNAEVFWRLHHRSSAWRTIGGGSANATTVGIRYGF